MLAYLTSLSTLNMGAVYVPPKRRQTSDYTASHSRRYMVTAVGISDVINMSYSGLDTRSSHTLSVVI
jgi:hypothetical protein